MKISSAGRVAAAVAALVAALTASGAPDLAAQVGGDDFPVALLAVVQLGALLTSCWVLLVLGCGTARLQIPGVPASVRTLLFTTLIVTAVASPAHADATHDLDGLRLPDRPMTAQHVNSVADTERVTVRSGDTLWDLAASSLPDNASTARIAESADRWHTANRQVIGGDPDLIIPGQILTPPTPEQDPP